MTYLYLALKFWRELLICLLVVLLTLSINRCKHNGARIDTLKTDYAQATTQHNLAVAKAKAHLEREARVAQQAFAEQATKNRQIKEQKNAEINTLSARLELSNDSLYELAKKAANADQRVCSTAASTKDKPTAIGLRTDEDATGITIEAADKISELHTETSTKYERLKAECVELKAWADKAESINQ